MTEARKILVTSALPYANGSIHLGHMLEYVQTDMWVRYQKLRGNQAIYVCADDAHGSAIMLRAEKEGITPEQLIDGVRAEHMADFADFGVDFQAPLKSGGVLVSNKITIVIEGSGIKA